MKTFPALFASLIISLCCLSLNAEMTIKPKAAATHFYTVNFDEKLLDIFALAKTGKIIKSNEEPVAAITDTFYTIAAEKFKTDLNLELLPINELKGKVKYSNLYPDCPDIKKVLKAAKGYKYYVDYYVNIYSNTAPAADNMPTDIVTPMYAISFTVYDDNGKEFAKMHFVYKSKMPLTKNKQEYDKLGGHIKSNLCSLYSEALNELTIEYKKILQSKHYI
jgi:hypothetical protein